MTTIAFMRRKDGTTVIAADRRVTFYGTIPERTSKIHVIDSNTVLACAGDNVSEYRAIQHFSHPHWPSRDVVEFSQPNSEFEAILLFKGKPYILFGSTAPIPFEGEKFAIGSGGDFARAAMELGKSPSEAVEFASDFDVNTSKEVEIYVATLKYEIPELCGEMGLEIKPQQGGKSKRVSG